MTVPHYVFVGAFREHQASDGSVGGQLYACRTLLGSELVDHVRFTTIDSTMESVPPPPLQRRVVLALKRMARYARVVARRDVDGVLIFTSAGASLLEKGLMAVSAKQLGKRVVLSPRSGLIRDDVKRSSAMRETVIRILRACDVVMCQSPAWKTFYQDLSGLPPERLQVVPNWLDASAYPQDEPRAEGGATFLYMGWLEPYKGILDLVEAVAVAKDEIDPAARFVVCGLGSLDEEARRLCEERGVADRFDFRGWVTGEAKRRVLEEADVLVLPSHREGMPNALLEAMASGLAVIATSVGGVPAVIVDDTVGELVPPHSPTELGHAIIALSRDPARRRALGVAARRHVVEQHDITTLWRRVRDLLDP